MRRLAASLPYHLRGSAAACRRETRSVVGVVPKGANHIFWQTVHAGAIKAAQEFGLEVEWNARRSKWTPLARSKSSNRWSTAA
jgi:ABC-type sugar transport system substrate-binding protein